MHLLFTLLYSFVLTLWAVFSLPKMLYDYFYKKKYRNSLWCRFGIGYPQINKGKKRLIWIHAVSVGETRAVSRLVHQIKENDPDVLLVVSAITETGLAEGKRCIPDADYHVYLPFDFRWLVRYVLNKAIPDAIILCETDFWFNFLDFAKSKGARLALVNGKLSERSAKRYSLFSLFSKRLFSLFDCIAVQNNIYQKRFIQAGSSETQTIVTGNLKFDEAPPALQDDELDNWRRELGLLKGQPVVTIGSSHDPEEDMLLTVLAPLWIDYPQLKILVVPRHPERFDAVANLLIRKNIPYLRYSRRDDANGSERVVLVDAMGLLRNCYQVSDVAIVAGSFIARVGGHNILEPIWYGVPVLFGPYMQSQPDFLQLVTQYGAGEQVALGRVEISVRDLLENKGKREASAIAEKHLLQDVKGATKRTLEILKHFKVI